MNRRLVILSEIIAPYRIPVFNALAHQQGIDLHVIFLAETDPVLRQWRIYTDEIRFSYEVLPSWRKRMGEANLLINWGLSAALRRARPDAILCGGYNYLSSWKAAWWARRHGVPFMVWVESTAQDLRSRRATVESLKRRFLQGCDAFVVAGQSSRDYLRGYQIRDNAIFSAPNAVDTEFFARHAERVRTAMPSYRQALGLPPRFLLFVGRLVPEKGVFDLIAAYGALAPELRAEIGLVFVGEGAVRSRLLQLASRIQPGQVQFAGFVQREVLAAYYALAEALVLPTRSDAWGLVVNEAMVFGLPIIASDVAGCVPDLVQDGWNGYLVPPGDVPCLASAMERLLRSRSAARQMRDHSRSRIRSYSPQGCAAGIVRAVASLSGGA